MAENLPYSNSVGTLVNMLEKIKTASTPERFTQDFVSTKLGMKGGTAAGCIPLLKKMGFVASDGSPTDLYKEFRNPEKSRIAIGKAFRKLYQRLYEMNEYLHDASDEQIRGMVVECTGGEKASSATKFTIATINALRKIADFDTANDDGSESGDPIVSRIHSSEPPLLPPPIQTSSHQQSAKGINLAYTINLNLPATKDIEVFNAIFKSLKEHILGD